MTSNQASPRWLKAALVIVAALLPAADAVALWDDKLELFISETLVHDSNVFRISDRVDPLTVIGSPSKSDTYFITSPGFALNIPYSRQRFLAGIRWDFARYDRFKVLDFDGHEGRAIWQWQAGNDWSGQLGYSESLALQSLANSQTSILAGQPNALETQRAFLNANWRMTPRWTWRGDLGRTEQDNELPLQKLNNIVIENAGLALLYATPLKNQVGLGVRVEEGTYPNRTGLPVDAVTDSYQQQNIDGILEYTVTGHSRLIARVGWVNRDYDQLSQRDFDEGTYNFNLEWRPGPRTTVNGIARREVSGVDDTLSRFVLLTGFALSPTWRVTEKITINLNMEYSSREYLIDPSLLIPGVESRTDWVRFAGLRVFYRPLRALTLGASLFFESRSSTFAFGDFEAKGGTVSARIGF
jgi:exopolysaccharide biosynthesis operon protein EpsL